MIFVTTFGGLVIVPSWVEVLGRAEAPLSIDDRSGLEHRLSWRFLDVRMRPEARLLFEIQTTVEQAMRECVYGQRFTEIHTPKLMGTASESGAEVFTLEYFGSASSHDARLGPRRRGPVR